MNELINNLVISLNHAGGLFWNYAANMFIQSSVLIIILLVINFLLRKKVRATFRYCLWLLVLVKLILPPGLSSPFGLGYSLSDNPVAAKIAVNMPIEQNAANSKSTEIEVPAKPYLSKGLDASGNKIASAEWPRNYLQTPTPTDFKEGYIVTPIPSSITWQGVVFSAWLLGMLILSLLLLQRIFFVRALIAQSRPAGERLLDSLRHCCNQIGISRKIELRLSENTLSPAVCGLFKPIILMPTGLLEKLSREKLHAVLIHELAHIKRADIWVNLVQTILQIVYFYNPFVWLANFMVRRIREQAVDEMVLVTLKPDAESYSNTLIDIAEMAFLKPSLSLRLIGVVESKKALTQRIKHMINRPIPKSARLGIVGLVVIIITGIILLPMAKAEKNIATESAENTEIPKFKTTFPNSVTVELLGICEHPSQGKQWWRPDGTILEDRPYEKVNAKCTTLGRPEYEFAALVNDPENQNPAIIFKIKDSSGGASNAITKSAQSTIEWTVTGQPKEASSTVIDLGVSVGKWKTKYSRKANEGGAFAQSEKGRGISWMTPTATKEGKTMITASYSPDNEQVRIAAVDKQGKLHNSENTPFASFSEIKTYQSEIDVPLENIDVFQLQTRPYKWVTFKNVSLKPGYETDVQIKKGKSITTKGASVVDISPADFKISFDEKRGVFYPVVSIQNKGDKTIPLFKLRFYRGRPEDDLDETGNKQGGWHEAGPIEPGKSWNECTNGFHLPDGQYLFSVSLDYDDKVPESDENNNYAELIVTVKDGRIIEKSDLSEKTKETLTLLEKATTKKALSNKLQMVQKQQEYIDAAKKALPDQLKMLNEQQERVEKDLNAAERRLKEIRSSYDIVDLEEHSYPHPITERLTRLQKERDDCILEINQLKKKIDINKQSTDSNSVASEELKKAEADLMVLNGKLEELENMVRQARADQRELDRARSEYQRQVSIRDERREALNDIKSQIEKLKMTPEEAEVTPVPASKNTPRAPTRSRPEKENITHAKFLQIELTESNKTGKKVKEVNLLLPLADLKKGNFILPEQVKKQMDAYGITINNIIEMLERGTEPIELLEVEQANGEEIFEVELSLR